MVATTPLSSWLSDPLHNQVTYKTCAQQSEGGGKRRRPLLLGPLRQDS